MGTGSIPDSERVTSIQALMSDEDLRSRSSEPSYDENGYP